METDRNTSEALVEKLSNPATVNALNSLVDRLTELHETGVMESFFQTMQAVTFMKDGLTDTMVSKNASMAADLMTIADEAASPDVLGSLRELKEMNRTGKLKDLSAVADAASFMVNSTTDKMLERNAALAAELYTIANEAADPDMVEAVRELKKLQKSGNLKTLSEASDMISFLSNAATDTMVQRMASFVADFVEEVSAPHITDILRSSTNCISQTIQQFANDPPKPGIKNLVSTMFDPEVQMGMMFMATMAKNMHKCMIQTYSGSTNGNGGKKRENWYFNHPDDTGK